MKLWVLRSLKSALKINRPKNKGEVFPKKLRVLRAVGTFDKLKRTFGENVFLRPTYTQKRS